MRTYRTCGAAVVGLFPRLQQCNKTHDADGHLDKRLR
jgi:hypothetical protein